MHNVKYDFSSVHVDVPPLLASEIVAWGKDNVHDDEIYVSQKDPTFGREDEIHITILYGLHTESPDVVKDLLQKQGPVKVRLGKMGVFTNPYKFDVVMIEVVSEDLNRLNSILREKVKHTNKYGGYKPHVTVAYVKKGKGWRNNGLQLWDGREFTCDHAVFSSKNGTKNRFMI